MNTSKVTTAGGVTAAGTPDAAPVADLFAMLLGGAVTALAENGTGAPTPLADRGVGATAPLAGNGADAVTALGSSDVNGSDTSGVDVEEPVPAVGDAAAAVDAAALAGSPRPAIVPAAPDQEPRSTTPTDVPVPASPQGARAGTTEARIPAGVDTDPRIDVAAGDGTAEEPTPGTVLEVDAHVPAPDGEDARRTETPAATIVAEPTLADGLSVAPQAPLAERRDGRPEPAGAVGAPVRRAAPFDARPATAATAPTHVASVEDEVALAIDPPAADPAAPGSSVDERPRHVDGPDGIVEVADLLGATTTAETSEAGTTAPSSALRRVLDAIEHLENAPPPRQLAIEIDGVTLVVSMRGDTVHVETPAGMDLGDAWHRDLARSLADRGLDLAGRGSGEQGRGDADRRSPDVPGNDAGRSRPRPQRTTTPDDHLRL